MLRQQAEHAFSFIRFPRFEEYVEALRRLEVRGERVNPAQDIITERKSGMDDSAVPLWRNLLRHGRIAVRHHRDDLTAERLFIKRKGLLALTIENEMWTYARLRSLLKHRQGSNL